MDEQLTPEEKLYWSIFREAISARPPHEHFLSPDGVSAIHNILGRFASDTSARGAAVIRLRYGIEPITDAERVNRTPRIRHWNIRTLAEVAPHFCVTMERIREIEAKALRQLRHPNYSRELKCFIKIRDGYE